MVARKNFPVEVRKQAILALLTPGGVMTKEITAALGYTTRSKPTALLRELTREGLVFGYTGASNEDRRFFATAEDRDAFAAQDVPKRAEIHRQQAAEASQRYREGSGIPRRNFTPKPPPEGVDASGTIAKLKKETKALGTLPRRPGTMTVNGPRPRGPAHIAGEPDLTDATITKDPAPIGRYDVSEDFQGEFGKAGIGRYGESHAWSKAASA